MAELQNNKGDGGVEQWAVLFKSNMCNSYCISHEQIKNLPSHIMASHKEMGFFKSSSWSAPWISVSLYTSQQCSQWQVITSYTLFLKRSDLDPLRWKQVMGAQTLDKNCVCFFQSYHCHGFHDTQKWFHQFTVSLQSWKNTDLRA